MIQSPSSADPWVLVLCIPVTAPLLCSAQRGGPAARCVSAQVVRSLWAGTDIGVGGVLSFLFLWALSHPAPQRSPCGASFFSTVLQRAQGAVVVLIP